MSNELILVGNEQVRKEMKEILTGENIDEARLSKFNLFEDEDNEIWYLLPKIENFLNLSNYTNAYTVSEALAEPSPLNQESFSQQVEETIDKLKSKKIEILTGSEFRKKPIEITDESIKKRFKFLIKLIKMSNDGDFKNYIGDTTGEYANIESIYYIIFNEGEGLNLEPEEFIKGNDFIKKIYITEEQSNVFVIDDDDDDIVGLFNNDLSNLRIIKNGENYLMYPGVDESNEYYDIIEKCKSNFPNSDEICKYCKYYGQDLTNVIVAVHEKSGEKNFYEYLDELAATNER